MHSLGPLLVACVQIFKFVVVLGMLAKSCNPEIFGPNPVHTQIYGSVCDSIT